MSQVGHLTEVGDEDCRVDNAQRGQLDGGAVEVPQVRKKRLRACVQHSAALTTDTSNTSWPPKEWHARY